jgi:hypothetical protein
MAALMAGPTAGKTRTNCGGSVNPRDVDPIFGKESPNTFNQSLGGVALGEVDFVFGSTNQAHRRRKTDT